MSQATNNAVDTAGGKVEELSADATGGSGKSDRSPRRTRPVQPKGEFPERNVTWYHVSSRELRGAALAQVGAAVFASIGTFALGLYLDLQKDIALAEANGDAIPEFFRTVLNLAWWGWVLMWGAAAVVVVAQFAAIEGIKLEHGDPPIWKRWWSKVFG